MTAPKTFDELYREGNTAAVGSGSRYWTAKLFLNAFAILVEVKDWKGDVPLFKPKEQIYTDKVTGAKTIKTITTENIAFADVTVFNSEEAIDQDKPSFEGKNVKIAQHYLALDLKDEVGGLLVKRIAQPNGTAIYWRPVPGEIIQKVGQFFDRRNAAVETAVNEAVAEAGDDVPDFMKVA